MSGVSSISAPELASVSSILFDSISRCDRRFWALTACRHCRGRRRRSSDSRLHPVDAGLDEAGRMGDALGLAIDHRDDLGHFLDGVADLAEPGLGAAALDAGLDLAGDGARLAGQLADGRARSGWWRRGCRGPASSLRRRPPRSCGRHRRHGPPRWWHSSASMLVLRAIVSIVEETVWTWFIAAGEAGHPLAQLDHQLGQALEALMVPSIASRPPRAWPWPARTAAAPRRSNR